MCQAVKCRECGKPTWVGCGAHVEQVLGHIPKEARCQGHAVVKPPASGAQQGSWWARLVGR
ncbi:MAG: hypothetical protein JNG84_05780 [Archangium sp.]|nr:hypothetical protein [Archangium sp.]